MLSPILALALQAAAPASGPATSPAVAKLADDIKTAPVALDRCYGDNVVRMGRGNQETGETLLIAARGICIDQHMAVVRAFDAIMPPGVLPGMADEQVKRVEQHAESSAIVALLAARHP